MSKDFLKTIVENKKKKVFLAKQKTSEKFLCSKVEKALKKRKARSFYKSLKDKDETKINVIAEIKRASPSQGNIDINLDPIKLVKDYEKGGAKAISVLTDTDFFKGSCNDFKLAQKNTNLAMLRKDFIISEYQVYQSYLLKADAILLIAKILSKSELNNLFNLATKLDMDALVEINDEKDFAKAYDSGATLIGINNRNLTSFETNMNTSVSLVSLLDKGQIPIAASTISNKDDIKRNLDAGIFNFLIGESLVRSNNTVDFLRYLIAI